MLKTKERYYLTSGSTNPGLPHLFTFFGNYITKPSLPPSTKRKLPQEGKLTTDYKVSLNMKLGTDLI
jgi:hypothetical protein